MASLFPLDRERVRSFLQLAVAEWPGGFQPMDIHIERVWPAGSQALSVEWSFMLGDLGRFSLWATPAQDSEWMGPEVRRPVITGGILQGIRIEVPDHGVLVHSPDHDAALPHLAECFSSGAMAQRLAGFSESGHCAAREKAGPGVQMLSYRARRRAAFKYRCVPSRLLGKTFRDARGARALRWHRALSDDVGVADSEHPRVALPVGFVPELQLALFSWCDDFRPVTNGEYSSENLRLAMKALAWLHRTPLADLPAFSAHNEAGIVERWRSALALAGRTEVDGLDDLMASWQAQAPPKAPPATIHRDFYSRQVLVSDARAMLVDLDTLALGDPALDVGNFLAHLWLDALQYRPDDAVRVFEAYAGQALEYYNDCGGRLNSDSLQWYTASSLMRLGAVHILRTRTERLAEGLWALAAHILEASPVENSCASAAHPVPSIPDIRTIVAKVEESR